MSGPETGAAVPLTLVVAVSRNGVIGRDNGMPWRLSSDLKRFKALTLGKPVVMGRRTLEAIGKPLPGRTNIVVSRTACDLGPDVTVVADLDAAIAEARRVAAESGASEVIIGGGGTVYAETIGRADRLRVTHVDMDVDGETRFPAIDPTVWRVVEDVAMEQGPRDDAAARFVTYERVAPDPGDGPSGRRGASR